MHRRHFVAIATKHQTQESHCGAEVEELDRNSNGQGFPVLLEVVPNEVLLGGVVLLLPVVARPPVKCTPPPRNCKKTGP